MPQLFKSVHVLVCVNSVPHDADDGDQSVHDQLGVHVTHSPPEHRPDRHKSVQLSSVVKVPGSKSQEPVEGLH